MSLPLLSIAIPTYSRLEYLKEAVQSVKRQTYKNIQIVIGLDPHPEAGPDKNILKYGKELSRQDPSVLFFVNDTNQGLGGNWNRCLEKCSGEYFIIIGDDDRLLPEMLSTLIKGVNEGADVVFSNQYLIDSYGSRLKEESEIHNNIFHRGKLSEGMLNNPQKWIWLNAVPSSAAIIRTSKAQEIGFSSEMNTPEVELFLKMELQGARFYFVPQKLMEFRVHRGSSTSGGLKTHLLVEKLLEMPVKKENKEYKNRFLTSKTSRAIKNFLMEGQKQRAWNIWKSSYFNKISVKGFFYVFIFLFPSVVSRSFIKKVSRLIKQ